MGNKKLLNLGCGSRFHKDWMNIDFNSGCKEVVAANLREGIPITDEEASVVYSSHVIEHFTPGGVSRFLVEIKRVLEVGGTYAWLCQIWNK